MDEDGPEEGIVLDPSVSEHKTLADAKAKLEAGRKSLAEATKQHDNSIKQHGDACQKLRDEVRVKREAFNKFEAAKAPAAQPPPQGEAPLGPTAASQAASTLLVQHTQPMDTRAKASRPHQTAAEMAVEAARKRFKASSKPIGS